MEEKDLRLTGELTAEELDVDALDDVIHVTAPLAYDLTAQRLEQSVLVQGSLSLALDCECVRCLKPFRHPLVLADWACHIPLEGEEKAAVVSDSVDLTPFIREDIVLAFPQHPLCKTDCPGLASLLNSSGKDSEGAGETEANPSPWAALDKLKLKN